jgi:hypothetical protein
LSTPRPSRRDIPDAEPPHQEARSDHIKHCWLCTRPLGRRVEWHHPRPKSRGGRDTVPVHPICHRTIHAFFSNAELARLTAEGSSLAEHPDIKAFLKWVRTKPPDFNAPTRRRKM